MNRLRNGSIAVGAPGSAARIAAEAADNALGNARDLCNSLKAILGSLLDKQASSPAAKAQYEFLKHLPETWAYIESAQRAIAEYEASK